MGHMVSFCLQQNVVIDIAEEDEEVETEPELLEIIIKGDKGGKSLSLIVNFTDD